MKIVPETRKRPGKDKDARDAKEDKELSDELDDDKEESPLIGLKSVSEAKSRSETPLGGDPPTVELHWDLENAPEDEKNKTAYNEGIIKKIFKILIMLAKIQKKN